MKSILFYFSGTGNNLAIAKKLAQELGNTTILPMQALLEQKEISSEYDWVGFLSPCYYSHVPPFVIECMRGIKYTQEQKVILIAGCGGNRGLSIQDMRQQVHESGKEVSLEYMVMLAGNYILSYGAFPKWYQDFFRKRSYKKIHKIAEKMKKNANMKPLGKGIFYNNKYEESFQKTIAGYSNVGKQYKVSQDCTKCSTCVKLCPVHNITLENGAITFGDHCNQCMACIQWCPKHAIDYDKKAQNRKHYHHKDIAVQDMFIR